MPTKRASFLAVIIACVAAATSCRSAQPQNLVCVRQACYGVEIAAAPEEQALGLMHREHLGSDKGMLFMFATSSIHSFWMKNTLIPLDMIWIDHARKAVHIEKNVPPCTADPCPRYTPSYEALYVLEVNAGEAARIGLQLGDVFKFKLKKE